MSAPDTARIRMGAETAAAARYCEIVRVGGGDVARRIVEILYERRLRIPDLAGGRQRARMAQALLGRATLSFDDVELISRHTGASPLHIIFGGERAALDRPIRVRFPEVLVLGGPTMKHRLTRVLEERGAVVSGYGEKWKSLLGYIGEERPATRIYRFLYHEAKVLKTRELRILAFEKGISPLWLTAGVGPPYCGSEVIVEDASDVPLPDRGEIDFFRFVRRIKLPPS